eukprot:GHVR01023900.1.p1 GENE.GHVR01023900.1~~GHVR01023900.1.p1  ORF type:complete len:244 (+),score=39.26 GHVR01023900.1:161-892(+)
MYQDRISIIIYILCLSHMIWYIYSVLECQPGDKLKQGACIPCEPHTYSSYAADECIDCTDGMHQPSSGMPHCVPCPVGTYYQSVENQAHPGCKPCQAGEYNDVTGETQCAACEPGTFSEPAAFECTACVPGKLFSSEKNKCTDCQVGSYWTEHTLMDSDGSMKIGNRKCVNCPIGSYQDKTGMLYCEPCANKETTLREGARGLASCIGSQGDAPYEEWDIHDIGNKIVFEGSTVDEAHKYQNP